MPSTFFGLQIGYSGLTAYQAAINTTGNNVANIETEGYTRQKTNQKASEALRTYTTYGMAGAGTTVNNVIQVRDSYYDIKYRNAAGQLGEYETKYEFMSQIQDFFIDDGEMARGFNSIYDDLFRSIEDLQNNPGDTSVRTAFVGQARSLCEYFNALSEDMTKLQIDCNNRVKDAVDQINSIGQQIATLNHQINTIELKGVSANELRDQRNLLVDKLSNYVNVEVKESPIYTSDLVDENGKPLGEPTGTYRYQVIIAGNNNLVDGYNYRELACKARETWDKTNQSDADGMYDMYWIDNGVDYYPVGGNYNGELKALLQMRDGNNGENFKGMIDHYDPVSRAVTIKTDDINQYLQDVSKCTLNPTGEITLGVVEYRYERWSVSEDDDGTFTYTFYLADDSMQTEDNNGTKRKTDTVKKYEGLDAHIGESVAYQGVPYYMAQMNEWIRLFAKSFNEIEQKGEDLYGNSLAGNADKNIPPTAFFVARKDKELDFSESYNTVTTSTGNTFYQLTAGNFRVNKDILEDVSKMSTSTTDGAVNLEENDIVDELQLLKGERNFFRGCTSAEFLQCVLSDIAINTSSAKSFQQNFTNVQNSIQNQRLSVSGVDDDEEALNLVKFQNAFNLNAKMIQTMTEIYNRLILETGV